MPTTAYIPAGLGPDDSVMPSRRAGMATFITAGIPPDDVTSGHRLYLGTGGLGSIDFGEPVAAVFPGVSAIFLNAYGFAASSRYTLVVRPVINGVETPDYSCRTQFETDGDGQWLGVRPTPVEQVAAETLSGARVKVSWTYRTPEGAVPPNDFGVYYGSSPRMATGSPNATVDYTRDKRYSHTFALSDAGTYHFAVTARTSAPVVESGLCGVTGPVIADSTGPDRPPVIVTRTF